jgi:hypothetical protein
VQGFLAKAGIQIDAKALSNARREPLGPAQARSLLAQVDEIYAARGRTVERVVVKGRRLDDATVARVLMGPTGNLRAPTLRVGRRLLVGFDEETYRRVFET